MVLLSVVLRLWHGLSGPVREPRWGRTGVETRREILGLESELRRGADSTALRLALGQRYLSAGGVTDALAQVSRAVDQSPENADVWLFYAKVLLDAKREADAVEAFKKAIRAAQRHAEELEAEITNEILDRISGGSRQPHRVAKHDV